MLSAVGLAVGWTAWLVVYPYLGVDALAYHLTEIVTCLVGISVFSLIAWLGFLRAIDSYHASDVMAGGIPWPMWPSIGLVPFGAGLITLRLVLHLIAHVLSLAPGRSLIALPASHAASETFE